jgi:PAS domain S-box-containing protein
MEIEAAGCDIMENEHKIDKDLKDEILREQVRLVMQQIPTMQGTSFIVALVLSYVVRDIVPRVNTLAWLLMVLAIVLGRIWFYHRFGKVREGPFAGDYWKKCYLILALVSGIIWGFSALVIFPSGNPGLISLFVVVIASLSAATTISHSSVRLAPAAWSGPALLLYAVRCVMEGSELGYTVGFLILLYLYTILRHSFTHHISITSAIALRFENLELLEELQKANDLLRQDILEGKRTEEAINRAKEEWESTFDSVPDLIAILDDHHGILRMNKAMADRLGISREEMAGPRCYELVHGTASPPDYCPHTRSLADGQVHTVEVSIARLKGDFFVTVSPLYDARGRFIGSVHVARDITEGKRAEAALRQSEDKYRKLAESIPGMVFQFVLHKDGSFSLPYVNRRITEYAGIPPEAAMAEPSLLFAPIYPDDQEMIQQALSISARDLEIFSVEHRLVDMDGHLRWFRVESIPQRLSNDDILWNGVSIDITARKRAERALSVSHAFLTLSHRHEDLPRLIEEFSQEVKAVTGCGAVAIRILGEEGQNVCEVCDGFQQPLSVIDDWISRLTDHSPPFSPGEKGEGISESTAAHGGSFFHNEKSTPERAISTEPETTREVDPEVFPYESIGRVAIRSRDRLLGFVYAADERKAMFSQEVVGLLQDAAMHMGTAVQKVLAQESLELAHQVLEMRVEERTEALSMANRLLEAEILERRSIEEDLRGESAFREAINANATEGLCVWRLIEEYPYMRFTVWNRAMEEITGYSMEEINRLGWVQTMYEDLEMQIQVMAAIKRIPKERLFSRRERSVRRADGKRRTVVISSSVIQARENREHMIALLQDITELKEAEHALRQSEMQFRGLVENIRVGILILKDGRIVYQNPEQERLLSSRLTPPYPIRSLVEAVHSDDRPAFEKLCEAFPFKEPASFEAVVRLVSPGGGETEGLRWAGCRCSAIEYRGEEANLIHMMDITQLKNLERLVMQREKMASLGHVAAGIAHEIRNPLSGINVYLDAIRECYQDPECTEDVARLIQEAQATSNKIESVIRRVLDFSRPTDLRMRLTSINGTIHEALKLAAVSLRKASIDLDLDLDPDLLQVYADAQLIEQMMINLINNAANVLKAVQGERRIRISTRMNDGYVLIQVEDSGPGVPVEMRERVFEPFFTTRSQGMGIGLGICNRIIADHKGDIYISTSSMGGAQFNILIPVDKRSGSR